MPYNSSTGLVTAPVSLADAYAAFGAPVPSTGMDLGDLFGNYLKNNRQKIRMFARFKPVCHTDIFASNNKKDEEWWKAKYKTPDKGKDGDCGIKFQTPLADNTSWKECANESYMAQYIPPYGGADAAFRLADLDGYWTKAMCPFKVVFPNDFILSNKGAELHVSLNTHRMLSEESGFDSKYNLMLYEVIDYTSLDISNGKMYFTIAVENVTRKWVRFFQYKKEAIDFMQGDDQIVIRVPLIQDQAGGIVNGFETNINNGDAINIYAMLGNALSNSSPVSGNDDVVRSTAPPSPWRSLYFDEKPMKSVEATFIQTNTVITVTPREFNVLVEGTGANDQALIRVQSLIGLFTSQYGSGDQYINARLDLFVGDTNDNTLVSSSILNNRVIKATQGGNQVTINEAMGTPRFEYTNKEIYDWGYGVPKWEFNVRLTFSSNGYDFNGAFTGKLKLTKTGNNYNWTFTKS